MSDIGFSIAPKGANRKARAVRASVAERPEGQ